MIRYEMAANGERTETDHGVFVDFENKVVPLRFWDDGEVTFFLGADKQAKLSCFRLQTGIAEIDRLSFWTRGSLLAEVMAESRLAVRISTANMKIGNVASESLLFSGGSSISTVFSKTTEEKMQDCLVKAGKYSCSKHPERETSYHPRELSMINTPGARPVSVNPGVAADMVAVCPVVKLHDMGEKAQFLDGGIAQVALLNKAAEQRSLDLPDADFMGSLSDNESMAYGNQPEIDISARFKLGMIWLDCTDWLVGRGHVFNDIQDDVSIGMWSPLLVLAKKRYEPVPSSSPEGKGEGEEKEEGEEEGEEKGEEEEKEEGKGEEKEEGEEEGEEKDVVLVEKKPPEGIVVQLFEIAGINLDGAGTFTIEIVAGISEDTLDELAKLVGQPLRVGDRLKYYDAGVAHAFVANFTQNFGAELSKLKTINAFHKKFERIVSVVVKLVESGEFTSEKQLRGRLELVRKLGDNETLKPESAFAFAKINLSRKVVLDLIHFINYEVVPYSAGEMLIDVIVIIERYADIFEGSNLSVNLFNDRRTVGGVKTDPINHEAKIGLFKIAISSLYHVLGGWSWSTCYWRLKAFDEDLWKMREEPQEFSNEIEITRGRSALEQVLSTSSLKDAGGEVCTFRRGGPAMSRIMLTVKKLLIEKNFLFCDFHTEQSLAKDLDAALTDLYRERNTIESCQSLIRKKLGSNRRLTSWLTKELKRVQLELAKLLNDNFQPMQWTRSGGGDVEWFSVTRTDFSKLQRINGELQVLSVSFANMKKNYGRTMKARGETGSVYDDDHCWFRQTDGVRLQNAIKTHSALEGNETKLTKNSLEMRCDIICEIVLQLWTTWLESPSTTIKMHSLLKRLKIGNRPRDLRPGRPGVGTLSALEFKDLYKGFKNDAISLLSDCGYY